MPARWITLGLTVAVLLGSGQVEPTSAVAITGERSVFVPITPCRVMDTRSTETIGPRSTPLAQGDTHTITVHGTNGNCEIPPDSIGLGMNVTAINPTAASFLTVFAADANRPLASNLNWVAASPPVPNAVTVDISNGGAISFYNLAGTVDVAADIVGYYVDHNHDDRYFTEPEMMAQLGTKADVGSSYTKAESDASLAIKANTSDVTALLAPKANASDVTALLAPKANISDMTTLLAGKVDVGSVYTIAQSDQRSVRAAVRITCGPSSLGGPFSFNNLPGGITITSTWNTTFNGCVLGFGADISNRVWSVSAFGSSTLSGIFGAQCSAFTTTQLLCQRYSIVSNTVVPGVIGVIVV